MKKIFFVCLFLEIPAACFPQLIFNSASDVKLTEFSFNPFYIRANKIKSITAHTFTKADLEAIVDKGMIESFEFDSTGLLMKEYITRVKSTEAKEVKSFYIGRRGRKIPYTRTELLYTYDTTSTRFFYNKNGELTCRRTRDGDLYEAWYYDYDSLGKVKKELRCKETNVAENKNEFRLGVQTIVSLETFEYKQLTPRQFKKFCLNDDGKVYKYSIINIDELGNKLDESFEFIAGWLQSGFKYRYDGSSRLTEIAYYSNASGDLEEKNLYEYDKTGNTVREKKEKNGQVTSERDYNYDAKNNLEFTLDRVEKEKSFTIIKFSYAYF